MPYYIKTIGIKGKRISIFEGRFPRMLLYNMCFKNEHGEVQNLRKGDRLVIYCVKNGVKEFSKGGFIGIQEVLSGVYENRKLFKKPWYYIADIQPNIYSLRNIITLKEVKNWKNKSSKLKKALNVGLEAIGGLLEIDKSDYERFHNTFKRKKKVYFRNL